ncbi:TPA: hypothetical protein ACH3X2_006205 [Trebouxia sp. C0005]
MKATQRQKSLGARAAEIFQPVYHDNDRAYASLYFKFASSQSYQSNARQRLRVPDFQQPIECSCCVWHPQLRGVSESSTDFDRMRQGELKAALAVYADKSGLVDATSVQNPSAHTCSRPSDRLS